MTQYLNTVPFGNNAYGVAAAAQTYFGEPALKLTVSQAAMLAAMVNQPSFFSPDPSAGAGYTALVARWHYVLDNMVRDGALTQAQADAQTFPKVKTANQLRPAGPATRATSCRPWRASSRTPTATPSSRSTAAA